MIHVLDACSILAYLSDEPGGPLARAILDGFEQECHVHAVNLCEVYYHLVRVRGIPDARSILNDLAAAGLMTRVDFDREFLERVGEHKARGRISLADCICLALAERVGGNPVTADHGEFDPIVALNLCPIVFIR